MLTMNCPKIPRSKAKDTMNRTKSTGNEHAFIVCGDGHDTDILEGDESSLDIEELEGVCRRRDADDGMIVFHTHPNGIKRLSHADKRVAARDDVDTVCVGDPEGEFMCRTDRKCKGSVRNDD